MIAKRGLAVSFALGLALGLTAPAAAMQDQTYEEALAELQQRFAAADTNEDGRLTRDEARAAEMNRLARFFGRVDTEDRGYVTLEQLTARLRARYE